ncbi:extracellular solute-binding protein [Arthrobacter sp. JZ12]|uniref:ABC transporter substrate-binding protein n=1 Tax=Arthrobacter sp. JZ12 TaxID=2654190 RepID=UPI002B499FEB|nr:extracellular solute-binding protein [Arthrobacter sp. JZ12]WRH26104.1 extracellular solute-binding protein [Arthrobacter sp. JZ12]
MKKFARSTRTLTAAAVVLVLGATLSACGSGGSGGNSAGGDSNLRFSWWGSDPRHVANQEIIDMFEAENEGITIEGEYSDFSGYWDKLATTTAGRDAPDVITMDEKYLQEYAGRGALADLSTLDALDTSKFDDAALNLGRYEDGLYGLTTGQNAYVLMVNKDLFAKAGVEVPDDTTWTWDDYYRISEELQQKLGGDIVGTDYGAQDVDLRVWLRQQGENLYDDAEPGKVGYSPENVESWFEHLLTVRDSGGPSAARYTEEMSGSFEAGGFATNRAAMGWYWSNQLSALREASGSDVAMLRFPSHNGEADDNGMYYKASMYWSISSQSDDQEAAAEFVNYLANNPDAAKKMLVDRGVPANPDMAEAIEPELDENDQSVVNFLDEIRPDMAEPPLPSPVGAGGVQDVVKRYASEVLFDKLTPAEATEQMTTEIEGMISAG